MNHTHHIFQTDSIYFIMLSSESIISLKELVSHHINKLDSYSPVSSIYKIEARFTLNRLQDILAQNDIKSIVCSLTFFLNSRWYWIQDTDVQYTHDIINPANYAAIALAKAIADNKTPYLNIIIPTLTSECEKITYLSSGPEDNPSLQESILVRQNKYLLNIADLIESAQEEGLLRPNFLIDGKVSVLSQHERNMVFAKHPFITEAYASIQDLVTYKYYGNTVGAALKRLIKGLLGGGKNMGASEIDCEAEATLAIAAFAEYLEFLNDETKAKLFSAQKFDRFKSKDPEPVSIETLWSYLSRDKSTNYMEFHFCVEIIASGLDEILQENPELYNLGPTIEQDERTFASLNESVLVARKKMQAELENLTHHHWFKKDGEKKHIRRFLKNLLHYNHSYQLTVQEMTILIDEYHNYSCNRINQYVCSLIRNLDKQTITEIRDSISLTQLKIFDDLYLQAMGQDIIPALQFFNSRKRLREDSPEPTLVLSSYSDSNEMLSS